MLLPAQVSVFVQSKFQGTDEIKYVTRLLPVSLQTTKPSLVTAFTHMTLVSFT